MSLLVPLLALRLAGGDSWCPQPAADLHVDLPFQVHYRHSRGDTRSLPLRRGCVRTLVLSLYLPHRQEVRDLDALLAVLDTSERMVRRRGWARFDRAHGGQVGVVYSVEGSEALRGRLEALPDLVARGVLIYGPVHAHHNDLAESSTDPHAHDPGLSIEGEAFVEAVYAAGGLIDLAHASDATFDHVAARASGHHAPLIVTHTAARALVDHPRNLSDAQLRRVAESGGLVGVAFHAPFLDADWRDADLDDLCRHLEHMVRVMGARHVAVGSDLDGLISPGKGLEDHGAFRDLRGRLTARGMDQDTVNAVLGGNAERLLGTLASGMQSGSIDP